MLASDVGPLQTILAGVSNFIQTPSVNERILAESSHHFYGDSTPKHVGGRMERAMYDSQRYRDNAAACLLAAQEARQLQCRRLHLSMAVTWLSLAQQDEAMDNSGGTAAITKSDGPRMLLHFR
jgi:hypothetical protein